VAAHPALAAFAAAAIAIGSAVAAVVVHNHSGGAAMSANPNHSALVPDLSRVVAGHFAAMPPPALPGAAQYDQATCPTASICYVVGSTPLAKGVSTVDAESLITSTHDGGTTWSTSTFPVGYLGGISCPTALDCYETRADGTYTTHDGTATWQRLTNPGGGNGRLGLATCPTARVCLAFVFAAASQTLWATSDGGGSWTPRAMPSSAPVRGVRTFVNAGYCLDAAHCWLVGSDTWFSADFGATWKVISPPRACGALVGGGCPNSWVSLNRVDFTSPTEGWVIGGRGCGQCQPYVAHTADGGATWSEADTRILQYASDIACIARTCIAVGESASGGDSIVLALTDGTRVRELRHVPGRMATVACDPTGATCVVAGSDANGAPSLLLDRGR
jgi:photosystem II stability/assembly factor-like uncharacterized protein